jgi:predicted ATPase
VTSLRGSPLLERDSELRQAGALLTAAAEGDGGALVVEGPAGIGKSTLLREIRERQSASESSPAPHTSRWPRLAIST